MHWLWFSWTFRMRNCHQSKGERARLKLNCHGGHLCCTSGSACYTTVSSKVGANGCSRFMWCAADDKSNQKNVEVKLVSMKEISSWSGCCESKIQWCDLNDEWFERTLETTNGRLFRVSVIMTSLLCSKCLEEWMFWPWPSFGSFSHIVQLGMWVLTDWMFDIQLAFGGRCANFLDHPVNQGYIHSVTIFFSASTRWLFPNFSRLISVPK